MSGRLGSLAGHALALGIGVAAALGLGEVAARVALPGWTEFSSERFMTEIRSAEAPPYTIGRAGFSGHFAENSGDFRVAVSLNELGFRTALPAEAADRRLWVIGDSFAFGWGVEADETVAAILERLSGRPTYPAASPGANICGYESLAGLLLPKARPAAVLVMLTMENDVVSYDCRPPQTQAEPGANPDRLGAVKERLMAHSALYNLVAQTAKRSAALRGLLERVGLIRPVQVVTQGYDPAVALAAVPGTVAELGELRRRLPAGTPFAVLPIPSRFDLRDRDPAMTAIRDRLKAEAAVAGIPILDPFDRLAAAGFAAVHFAHDGHWTPMGHRLAAETAAGWARTLTTRPTP